MINELAIVVNTHSSCSDLWKIFVDKLSLFLPEIKNVYFFTDSGKEQIQKINKDINVILYSEYKNYTDQFLYCVKQVKQKYIIYTNEDYFLYEKVDIHKLLKLVEILENNNELSFIKLIKGPEVTNQKNKFKEYENLFSLENNSNIYSMATAIWKTKDKEKIYQHSPAMHIADKGNMPQFESHAYKTCQMLGIKGCVYYEGEEKRGMHHHDSNIFPYIASALVKGKWNVREYANELYNIFGEYNIDPNIRGMY